MMTAHLNIIQADITQLAAADQDMSTVQSLLLGKCVINKGDKTTW